MSFQRDLPHVDPEAERGPLVERLLRLMDRPLLASFETSFLYRMSAWRLVPRLVRLTGGRLDRILPLPVAVIETRDSRNGRPHRRAVLYFHDGDRVILIPSKAGWHEDPYWLQNAVAEPAVGLEATPFVAEVVADPLERTRLWSLADRFYPPCAAYRDRAARFGRTIPLLRLAPKAK
jgi:deazaflavin-dependent oxidoreductase (nitroreductase family)